MMNALILMYLGAAGLLGEIDAKPPRTESHGSTEEMTEGICAKNVQAMTRRVKCEPRPTIVTIADGDEEFIPNVVLVNKCAGHCTGNCAATRTEIRRFSVISRNDKKCVLKEIEEDVQCRCGCTNRTTNCPAPLVLDEHKCSCVCPKVEALLKHSANVIWDQSTCKYLCREKECTTGSFWDQNTCRCKPIR